MLGIFHNSMLGKRRLIVSNSTCRGHHLTYSMNFFTNTERNQTCSVEAYKATALYIIRGLYNAPWAGIWPFPRQLLWKSTRSLSLYMTDGSLTRALLSWRGELEVAFGKTRQLCMYMATGCEYGSFFLQYTGQSPSIIQTVTLGSRECWAGEGLLAGVRREWSQLRWDSLHHLMTHLSELNNLYLYRSKLTGYYESALILLPSVIMLVRLE